MKDQARGFVIAAIVLAMALPVVYVGTEGAWYLTTGRSYFGSGSTYRTLYAPLDWAGDRWSPVYDGRQAFVNAWLRLSGDDSRRALVRSLPSPYYSGGAENAEYFPPLNEFKLRPAAASIQYGAENLPPSSSAELGVGSSCSFEANYAERD